MSWVPTAEQCEMRDAILQLVRRGRVLIGEWVEHIQGFTFEAWEGWWGDKDFRAWWVEQMPGHGRVQEADLRMLENLAMRSLAVGLMDNGNDRSAMLSAWNRIHEARSAAGAHNVPDNDEEWLAYLGGNPEHNWLSGGETPEA